MEESKNEKVNIELVKAAASDSRLSHQRAGATLSPFKSCTGALSLVLSKHLQLVRSETLLWLSSLLRHL